MRSVPIGEVPPAPPNPDPGQPVQFRVMARWESAKPVRLAGGPELPELTGQFYVIRLRGLPLMPPPKTKPEEVTPNPNEGMLQAIREGSRLERKDKPGIPCAHLFKGSGDAATEVLLFFPQGADPIQVADKLVTLESQFAPFHLSVKFPLKDMDVQGRVGTLNETGHWLPASPSSPRLLELLRHIIPSRIRHLGIFHGRLNIRVSDPVLDPLHAAPLAQCVAQQCFKASS